MTRTTPLILVLLVAAASAAEPPDHLRDTTQKAAQITQLAEQAHTEQAYKAPASTLASPCPSGRCPAPTHSQAHSGPTASPHRSSGCANGSCGGVFPRFRPFGGRFRR